MKRSPTKPEGKPPGRLSESRVHSSFSQYEINIVFPILESFVSSLVNGKSSTHRERIRLRRALNGLRPTLKLHRLQRAILISEPGSVEVHGACDMKKGVDRLVVGMMNRLNQQLQALSASG